MRTGHEAFTGEYIAMVRKDFANVIAAVKKRRAEGKTGRFLEVEIMAHGDYGHNEIDAIIEIIRGEHS